MSNRRTTDADAAIAELQRRNPDLRIKDDGRGSHPAPYRLTEVQPHPARQPAAPTEHEEQVALFQWAAAEEGAHPELAMLLSIPNGGHRHPVVAAKMKAEGQKAGAPDILFLCRRGRFGGMAIELKRADKSNKPTPEQREWIERLRHYGYCAIVAYGAQEAIDAIKAYLGIDERNHA